MRLVSVLLLGVLSLLSLPTVLSSVESLNNMVRHFEPLRYDASELLSHHRARRDLEKSQIKIPFKFQAFGRIFDLELFPDDSVFSPDLRVTDGVREYAFDRSKLYSGRSKTAQPMFITGHLYHDVFSGVIVTDTETYVVEPSDRHFNTTQHFHTIIYKESDIVPVRGKMCGMVEGEIKESDVESMPTVSSLFADNGLRVRRQVNMNRRTCSLIVDLENKYVDSVKGTATDPDQIRGIAMGQVATHLNLVTRVFMNTQFSSYSDPGVFIIVPMVIINLEVEPLYVDNFIGVEAYLIQFSETNHNGFCLAYKFTHRDFNDGVLGLAYVANTRFGAGGICDSFTGSRGLNTGIVTTLNFGRTVPTLTTSLTWAHEMGHNFGSQHDATGNCIDQPDGNYIMFPRANDGSQLNNMMFSPCSISMMSAVIDVKGSGPMGCFEARTGIAFCGNGIVEEGEQCDCGFTGDCTDVCCDPSNCTLRGVECSPTEGACCFGNCTYKALDTQCLSEAECSLRSGCTGMNASCPTPEPKLNRTMCNNNMSVCFNGECSSSYCLFNNLFDCDLASANATLLCEQACTNDTNIPSYCVSTFQLAMTTPNIEGRLQVVGGLCNGTNGYCDHFRVCRSPNDEGPLTRLTNLILSPETLMNIQEYLIAYWWAVLLGGIALIILLVFITWLCSVVPLPSFGGKKGAEDLTSGPKKKKSGLVLRNPKNN